MSIIGILASNFFASGVTQSHQSTQGPTSKFEQIKAEFQQLGQDLQSGNLTQAQKDYTTLSQEAPGLPQTQNGPNPLAQAFNQLGQDLQGGNLQAAQKDYATLQQDAAQVHGHRHQRHGSEDSQEAGAGQQTNSINQAFGQLAQFLHAGNLSAAQSAFATLQNDLQQIGGFLPAGSASAIRAGGSAVQAGAGNLNVSA
jgi:hypothetical protein